MGIIEKLIAMDKLAAEKYKETVLYSFQFEGDEMVFIYDICNELGEVVKDKTKITFSASDSSTNLEGMSIEIDKIVKWLEDSYSMV